MPTTLGDPSGAFSSQKCGLTRAVLRQSSKISKKKTLYSKKKNAVLKEKSETKSATGRIQFTALIHFYGIANSD